MPKKLASIEYSDLRKPESKEGPRAAYVEDGDDEADGGHVGEGGLEGWHVLRKGWVTRNTLEEGWGMIGKMRRGNLVSEDWDPSAVVTRNLRGNWKERHCAKHAPKMFHGLVTSALKKQNNLLLTYRIDRQWLSSAQPHEGRH